MRFSSYHEYNVRSRLRMDRARTPNAGEFSIFPNLINQYDRSLKNNRKRRIRYRPKNASTPLRKVIPPPLPD
jgi:hypothetical protein